MELHKLTKDLALRPQYMCTTPEPEPKLFGQTRPEVKKPYPSWPAGNTRNASNSDYKSNACDASNVSNASSASISSNAINS